MTENNPIQAMSKINYIGRTVTTATKYASLLGGIYSVCKDERDFGVATLFGVGYIVSDIARDVLREVSKDNRASILKDRLKE